MTPHTAPAEAIAESIALFRAGAVRNVSPGISPFVEQSIALIATSTIVDVTPLHRSVIARNEGHMLYEDTTMRPPWVDCAICYHQPNGAVIINHVTYMDAADFAAEHRWQPKPPADHTIDWDTVRWVAFHTIWLAHEGHASGPWHALQYAVAEDGTPLDVLWTQLHPEVDLDEWTNPQLLTVKTLTFLNCRNVTLVEPNRYRSQRRRLDRIAPGVKITEVQVFPRGTSVRGRVAEPDVGGTPLTTVRGHLARYGPQYGRGLLFGKIEGQFWIPSFARGRAEHGTIEHSYTIEADA